MVELMAILDPAFATLGYAPAICAALLIGVVLLCRWRARARRVASMLRQAVDLEQAGRVQEAIAQLRRVEATLPYDPVASIALFKLYQRQGETAAAHEAYQEALRRRVRRLRPLEPLAHTGGLAVALGFSLILVGASMPPIPLVIASVTEPLPLSNAVSGSAALALPEPPVPTPFPTAIARTTGGVVRATSWYEPVVKPDHVQAPLSPQEAAISASPVSVSASPSAADVPPSRPTATTSTVAASEAGQTAPTFPIGVTSNPAVLSKKTHFPVESDVWLWIDSSKAPPGVVEAEIKALRPSSLRYHERLTLEIADASVHITQLMSGSKQRLLSGEYEVVVLADGARWQSIPFTIELPPAKAYAPYPSQALDQRGR